jgi:triosephosphate isomerase
MRTPFIAGNWKMYKTVDETVKYLAEFCAQVKGVTGVEIVIAPVFTALHAAAGAAQGTSVGIAAQDLYWEREGAFTGEVSGPMILEAGARYVIVGHSERRTLFGETDATVNRKTVAAFAAGLIPIVCIGETLDQRERNETNDVLDRQIKQGLDGLTSEQLTTLILAYEPVWAIGTRRPARRRRRMPISASGCASGLAARRPSGAGFFMAAASNLATSPRSRPSRTWTVRWSAAPAWM